MTMDIKIFYLNTPLKGFEYLQLKMSDIPEDVNTNMNYKKRWQVRGGYTSKLEKMMYKLPQAGLLAWELLEQQLTTNSYTQSKPTPGLWMHKRPITFYLIVYDFGVKYKGQENAKYLHNILVESYKTTADWMGKK